MEDWVLELEQGRTDPAWDRFVARYRKLILATIRRSTQDYDDVMDVFARVCEALREQDLRRLRSWIEQSEHRARFSTWLVTVVRNLTIDWFRHRDGRRRLSAVAERLPNIQRRIFELVYLDQRSHRECYEMLRSADMPGLTFREFRAELRATYQAVVNGRRGQIVPELSGFAVPLEEEVAGEIDPGPEPARQAVLEQALGLLDAEDRVAVELYVMGGVPADQVAAMLGLPNAKAVYNRVYRALAAVRERLETAGIRREDL